MVVTRDKSLQSDHHHLLLYSKDQYSQHFLFQFYTVVQTVVHTVTTSTHSNHFNIVHTVTTPILLTVTTPILLKVTTQCPRNVPGFTVVLYPNDLNSLYQCLWSFLSVPMFRVQHQYLYFFRVNSLFQSCMFVIFLIKFNNQ